MGSAPGKLPNQPGVNGTIDQPALGHPFLNLLVVVEEPVDFHCRGIGNNEKAAAIFDALFILGDQFFTDGQGAAVLPHNGPAGRLAGFLVPEDGGFPLVGNTNGGQVGGGKIAFLEGFRLP